MLRLECPAVFDLDIIDLSGYQEVMERHTRYSSFFPCMTNQNRIGAAFQILIPIKKIKKNPEGP